MATLSLVTTVGLDKILDLLSVSITHLVIGDSAATVTGAETALGHEVFRKDVTDKTRVDETLFVDTMVGTTEANFVWKEVGLIANGTATPGSGTLICRLLMTYDHTSTQEAPTVSILVPASRT
jgi:hypothetical protein